MTIHGVFILSIVSLFLFTLLGVSGPLWLVLITFVLFGIAWGMGNGLATPISLSKLPNTENAGLVSGASITGMNVFAVILLTLDTTFFQYKEHKYLFGTISKHQLNLSSDNIANVKALLSSPEKANQILSHLPGELSQKILTWFHTSFVHGMQSAFYLLLGIAIICWLIAISIMKKA